MDDIGGVLLNGRCRGDYEGEKTFCGTMGTSVIDYACCSMNLLDSILDMEVISKPYSDHMPITLRLKTGNDLLPSTPILPKIRWNQKKVLHIRPN